MFKAALSRTFDILVALAALVLLYWLVLGGSQAVCEEQDVYFGTFEDEDMASAQLCADPGSLPGFLSNSLQRQGGSVGWHQAHLPGRHTSAQHPNEKKWKKKTCVHVHTHMHTVLTLHFTRLFIMAHGEVSQTHTYTHTKSDCHQSFVQLHDVALQEGSWREGSHEGDNFNLKLVQRVQV